MIEVLETTFSFDNFELNRAKRLLLKDGKPVPLNSRSFDLLSILIENRGQIVSKDDLINTVWEGQFVEENNLTVQISTLRKIFDEKKDERRFIATVPGKGYSFIADVKVIDRSTDLIVEKHEYSQIVVEDYLPTNGTQPQMLTSASGMSFGVKLAVLGVIALIAAAAIGGGVHQWRNGQNVAVDPNNSFYQNHTVRQLTTNGNVGMAALSPDGKLFAYTIEELGQKSLWIGNIDGGNHLQLKEPSDGVYRSLTFSPDNNFLYYSLQDDKNPKSALMKIPVLGGLQEKILDEVQVFSLSPAGDEIAIARLSNENDLVVSIMPLDGSPERKITTFDKKQQRLADTLSWSRDKTKLAAVVLREDTQYFADIAVIDVASGSVEMNKIDPFLRDISKTRWLIDGSGFLVTALEINSQSSVPHYRIYQVNYPSGTVNRITNDRSQYGESWHNDAGVSLSIADETEAFISVEHRQVNNIWLADADNLTDQRQITFGSFGKFDGLWGLDWTPEGDIVFVTSDTESQFIARIKSDGSDRKQITGSGRVDSSLSLTADGQYIVFHSNRGTDFGIWRTNIDGSDAKQITLGGEAFQPTPSADSKWVYYKSYVGENKGFMCRVPIDGGKEECFTDNETSRPSFSPDGKYIAAIYRTDKSQIAIFSAIDHKIVRLIDLPKNATSTVGIRWKADGSAFTMRDAYLGYWMFPVVGEPYKLDGLPQERMYNFAWSRDGKSLAFVRGQENRDVVLFSNAK